MTGIAQLSTLAVILRESAAGIIQLSGVEAPFPEKCQWFAEADFPVSEHIFHSLTLSTSNFA